MLSIGACLQAQLVLSIRACPPAQLTLSIRACLTGQLTLICMFCIAAQVQAQAVCPILNYPRPQPAAEAGCPCSLELNLPLDQVAALACTACQTWSGTASRWLPTASCRPSISCERVLHYSSYLHPYSCSYSCLRWER